MNGITETQRATYDFICSYIDQNGCAPTHRELGAHFQIAAFAVECRLDALEKKGLIRRRSSKARSIVPVRDAIGPIEALRLAAERARALLSCAGSDIAAAIAANQIRTAIAPLEADLRGAASQPRKAAGTR